MSSPPISPTADSSTLPRHRFIIVVPVADRPRHIAACLDSLRQLGERYPYPHETTVLIADDSADPAQVAAHRSIAENFSAPGLKVVHFGPEEQWPLIEPLRAALPQVIGTATPERFGHKGQGVMRNIAYLKVAELLRQSGREDEPKVNKSTGNALDGTPGDPLAGPLANAHHNTLIWSLDSDQEFCVKVATPAGDREVYAIDFLRDLDTIFSRTDALVLTGKVVGDPPVSPAVMTGNFLADVAGFLQTMAARDPHAPCAHHDGAAARSGEAAYHDMAELFGFAHAGEACDYPCPLTGSHDEASCFAHFAARLHSFFYGEHPTRVSYYEASELFATVKPARTVYAGNYVFRPAALRYFIPFAQLRLRMSGPTLGRLMRAELGPRFVSANLPMLHKRTVESGGQSEFRPGIETQQEQIDMSGEFERQFYGDVMLFSIERLSAGGHLDIAAAGETLDALRAELLEKYNARQRAILDATRAIRARLDAPARWWNRAQQHGPAVAAFTHFLDNIERNFDASSSGHARINSPAGWAHWRTALLDAVEALPADRTRWKQALGFM